LCRANFRLAACLPRIVIVRGLPAETLV